MANEEKTPLTIEIERAARKQEHKIYSGGIFTQLREQLDSEKKVRKQIAEDYQIPLEKLNEIFDEQERKHQEVMSNES